MEPAVESSTMDVLVMDSLQKTPSKTKTPESPETPHDHHHHHGRGNCLSWLIWHDRKYDCEQLDYKDLHDIGQLNNSQNVVVASALSIVSIATRTAWTVFFHNRGHNDLDVKANVCSVDDRSNDDYLLFFEHCNVDNECIVWTAWKVMTLWRKRRDERRLNERIGYKSQVRDKSKSRHRCTTWCTTGVWDSTRYWRVSETPQDTYEMSH